MAGKEEEVSSVVEADSSKSAGSEATGGCGLKRKAEATEEAATVDVVVVDRPNQPQLVITRQGSEEVVYSDDDDEDDSDDDDEDDFDSDEDPEVSFAKIKARFEARVRECEACYPGLTYKDYSVMEDSHDDDKDELGDVYDGAVPA